MMKYKVRILSAVLLLLLLFPPLSLQADKVVLKNGRQLYGDILGQNRTEVRMRVDGRVRSFRKNKIRTIAYGVVKPKEYRSRGDKATLKDLQQVLENRAKEL